MIHSFCKTVKPTFIPNVFVRDNFTRGWKKNYIDGATYTFRQLNTFSSEKILFFIFIFFFLFFISVLICFTVTSLRARINHWRYLGYAEVGIGGISQIRFRRWIGKDGSQSLANLVHRIIGLWRCASSWPAWVAICRATCRLDLRPENFPRRAIISAVTNALLRCVSKRW